jgi:hypothetical protein
MVKLFKQELRLFIYAVAWMAIVRYAIEARDFSLLHSMQAGCGAQPTMYPVDMRLGEVTSPGYSCQSVKQTTHLPQVPRSRMVVLYLYSPVRLYGVLLK